MPVARIHMLDLIPCVVQEFDLFKKIYLQVCLLYAVKIFKAILKENHVKYSFGKCILTINMDQLFIFHILQIKFWLLVQEIQKLLKCKDSA